MNNDYILNKQKRIFGRLFLLSNKLQVIGDQIISGEMTITQWLLTAAIAKFGDSHPTLRELAELMGSSHQNVKQIAVKLQKTGFLDIRKDETDLRATRYSLTVKSYGVWKNNEGKVKYLLTELFKDLSEDEINLLEDFLNKLYEDVSKMEKTN